MGALWLSDGSERVCDESAGKWDGRRAKKKKGKLKLAPSPCRRWTACQRPPMSSFWLAPTVPTSSTRPCSALADLTAPSPLICRTLRSAVGGWRDACVLENASAKRMHLLSPGSNLTPTAPLAILIFHSSFIFLLPGPPRHLPRPPQAAADGHGQGGGGQEDGDTDARLLGR